MEIRYIETKMGDNEFPDMGAHLKLVIVVDAETEITVFGYGSEEAEIELRNVGTNDSYNPNMFIKRDTLAALAAAIVWAEPMTIAHLVMDTINNQ